MHDTKVLIFLLNTCRYHKNLLQSLTVKHCHKYGDPVLRCTLYYFPFEAIPAIEKVSIHRERFKEHFSLFSVCGCFLTKTVPSRRQWDNVCAARNAEGNHLNMK